MTKYNTEYDLLTFENPWTEVEIEDFLKIDFIADHQHKKGAAYLIYNLIRGNEKILMIRMQGPEKSAASWIYKVEDEIKRFIHTKEDLKELQNEN